MTRPVVFGLLLGSLVGAWILGSTIISPLADDNPLSIVIVFALVLLALAVPGFAVRRRGGRFGDSLTAGATAGAIVFALFLLVGILRVNLFLDVIRNRADWQNLAADYARSDFDSLRGYANYVYAKQILAFPLLGVTAGAISGSLGGLVATFVRRPAA